MINPRQDESISEHVNTEYHLGSTVSKSSPTVFHLIKRKKPKHISFSFLGDLRFNIIINSNYKNRASLKLGGEIIIKIGSNYCTGCPLLGGALKIRINNVSYERGPPTCIFPPRRRAIFRISFQLRTIR